MFQQIKRKLPPEGLTDLPKVSNKELDSKPRPADSTPGGPCTLSTQSLLTHQLFFYKNFFFLPFKTFLSQTQGRIKGILCLRSNKDNKKNM